jgi:hypothetical protein
MVVAATSGSAVKAFDDYTKDRNHLVAIRNIDGRNIDPKMLRLPPETEMRNEFDSQA